MTKILTNSKFVNTMDRLNKTTLLQFGAIFSILQNLIQTVYALSVLLKRQYFFYIHRTFQMI